MTKQTKQILLVVIGICGLPIFLVIGFFALLMMRAVMRIILFSTP